MILDKNQSCSHSTLDTFLKPDWVKDGWHLKIRTCSQLPQIIRAMFGWRSTNNFAAFFQVIFSCFSASRLCNDGGKCLWLTFVCREVSVLHLMLDKMIALMMIWFALYILGLVASDLRISCFQNAFVIILVQFLKPDPN